MEPFQIGYLYLEYGFVLKIELVRALFLEIVPSLVIGGINGRSDHVDDDAFLDIEIDHFLQKIPTIHNGHVDVQKDYLRNVLSRCNSAL